MLDGVVLNSTYNDTFDLADYHVDNIERIEIIRGSYSALYGSEAMGGVINIITKKPEDGSKFSVLVEGGDFYTFRELVSANGSVDNFKFVVSASRIDSEGNFERDEYENNTLSANLHYDFSNDSSLDFISRYIQSRKNIAILVTADTATVTPRAIFDQDNFTRRKTIVNSLSYNKKVSNFWDFNLTGSHFSFHDIEDDEIEENAPETLAFFNSNIKSTRYTLQTQHNFHIQEMDTITVGAVFEREEVTLNSASNLTLGGLLPANTSFDKHRTNHAFYVQNIFNWENRWVFIVGGRVDYYETFGSTFNPKVSSPYLFESTRTRLKANYGSGFHAPSFDQLFSNPLGNTSLEPEKSKSLELGVEQFIGHNFMKLGVTYFNIDFENLIVRDFSQLKFVNAEKARSRGMEAYAKITPMKGLAFNVNYTRTITENKTTGADLDSIPKYMLNFNVDYDVNDRLNVNMDLNFVGSEAIGATNVTGLDGQPLGDRNTSYKKVDLAVSYILAKNWESLENLTLYGTVLNLLDEEYAEVAAAPSPGITFRIGLKAQF